ncbi:UvrD-helicase domain-containing protein [Methylobacterium oxalidis]|uniref:UvrD-helicase domain-containing protein n=1 Tax=Methylobacterium oxalidis TaxID=944322 RepID=UPI003314C3CA
MTAHDKSLKDTAERATAVLANNRSLLVEAGAGSGKTALMAGRIAMVLASGVKPSAVAAVTFTELAASELLSRVRHVVGELLSGRVPKDLKAILPAGLNQSQLANLSAANARIEEITCTTIHGFCQRLIKPYPVEADIDPGASVMGRDEAEQVFDDLTDSWLRQHLSGSSDGLIADLVLADPQQALSVIRRVAGCLRHGRPVGTRVAEDLGRTVEEFRSCVRAFRAFLTGGPVEEAETAALLPAFEEMAASAQAALELGGSSAAVGLVTLKAHADLCTKGGDFRAFKKKGKWEAAAARVGLPKAEGSLLFQEAERHHTACCEAWGRMHSNSASRVLQDLVTELQPLLSGFRSYKRATAALDFDDLIFTARDLLRDHEPVRQVLAQRYSHVLVDEFQDTDPLQAEIFWRLCGEPSAEADTDWQKLALRPGALFLVGDPKQAIYRFRGADVAAYVRAREAIREQSPNNVLSISTNFRSCASILGFVNQRFENILKGPGQPGFALLDAYHQDHDRGPCVAALDVKVVSAKDKPTADEQRDAEADAVADLCHRLIGCQFVEDHSTGELRLCRPGDIALLAPSGTDLWRYEEALERHGIPVATQAGKGFFRRQEIQDLIALARVLADQRDTLALGALLRGPAVGLTDEELLDIVGALPPDPERPDEAPSLRLFLNATDLAHPLARRAFQQLQALALRANSTTPHELLSQAIDAMRLRSTLQQRHHGHAERALANVDLFLDLARPFAVRGMRAFAETMMDAWEGKTRAIEGRPDAQEESVALYTMHAAKGLEWPVVIPINTMTEVIERAGEIIDRAANCLYCPVFGVHPLGYDEALEAERAEINHERVRLWYVAATRARELLVLPRLTTDAAAKSWQAVIDLDIGKLPCIEVDKLPLGKPVLLGDAENEQTRELFAAQASYIADQQRRLEWKTPSRDEEGQPSPLNDGPAVLVGDDEELTLTHEVMQVQGSRDRGLVLHKLIEEVLSGEVEDDIVSLEARAEALIRSMGQKPFPDPSQGLSPAEVAGCVTRTLALPDVARLRPRLVHEFPVYSFIRAGAEEIVTAGIADAVALQPDGKIETVIDWKSDVEPTLDAIEKYKAQVLAYLCALHINDGLIVFVTTGQVVRVGR